MKCDSALLCFADIEFVKEDIPIRWLAASAFMVCSSVRSIGEDENDFSVLFKANQPFLKSSYISGCDSRRLTKLSKYFTHHLAYNLGDLKQKKDW